MTNLSLDEETSSNRRLSKIIETNKDSALARQLLYFTVIMIGLSLGAVILWFTLTHNHIKAENQSSTTPSAQAQQPSSHSTARSESGNPMEDGLQEQENQVILKDLEPEVRKIIEEKESAEAKDIVTSSHPQQKIPPSPMPLKTQKKAPLKQEKAPRNQKKSTPKAKAKTKTSQKKTVPTASSFSFGMVIEGAPFKHIEKFLLLNPKAYLALSPEQLAQKKYQTLIKKRHPKIVLDLQMEPKNKTIPLKPYALRVGMTENQIEKALDNVASSKHIVGIRNHMGSAFLADQNSALALFNVLKKRGWIFVDALTGSYDLSKAVKTTNVPHHKKTDTLSSPSKKIEKKLKASKNKKAFVFVSPTCKNLTFLKKLKRAR